ncbi:MAG TPA: hypothetical protein VJV78_43315 [Polyangiales bacterium]|nr:hypothetical protein [Polyangiales bacterium]
MRERSARIAWVRVAALVGMIAGLALSAPLLWAAVRAGLGLLALAAMLVVGWTCLQGLPYLGERLEQRLLRARMDSARDNPIEVLLVQLVDRTDQLERYRSALATVGAQIEGMRSMLEERRATAPQHDTHKQAAALQKMVTFQAHHLQRLAAAECALADYKQHLNAKRFEWSFAHAGRRVLDSLRARDRESIVRELLSDEATRAVQISFDQVFAGLAAELELAPQLRSDPTARAAVLTGELA